jgi:AcrR family transcriptional regulator
LNVNRSVSSISDPVRRRIVVSARAHFLTQGFRKVSMDELAAELGMSKKTLYVHFPSKAELLNAVIDDKLGQVDRDLASVFGKCRVDFNRTLTEMLACMQGHTAEIQPPFVRDVRREDPALFDRIQKRRAQLIQRYFGRLFEQGQKSGQVRKDLPVNLMIEILLGATQAIANPTRVSELGLTPSACFAAIASVVLQGILTGRKGRV